jgi:hypothetical protein
MNTIRFIILTVLFLSLFCGLFPNFAQSQVQPPAEQQQTASFPSGEAFKNASITYILIPGINNTWGYDILVENIMKIHQPNIPGLPGNKGFKTKAGAEKIAKLVITKMKAGEMPPTITIEEMKKLNAI